MNKTSEVTNRSLDSQPNCVDGAHETDASESLRGRGIGTHLTETEKPPIHPTSILADGDGKRYAVWYLDAPCKPDALDAVSLVLEPDEPALSYAPPPYGWTEIDTGPRYSVQTLLEGFTVGNVTVLKTKEDVGATTIHGVLDEALMARQIELALSTRGSVTPSGKWKNYPMTLGNFVNSLAVHKEGDKDGPCFIQGATIDGERRANAIRHLDILTLDLDTGESIEDVISRIKELGLFAVVYTTHSNLKPITEVKNDEVLRWLGSEEVELTAKHVADYLIEKKRYRPAILEGAVLLGTEHGSKGVMLRLQHKPMPKFRVVMVLKDRFTIAERAKTQKAAIAEWKERYAGASKKLGAFFDRSCTDPSRLMYLPRHPKGGEFSIDIIAGEPLDIETCERVTAEELRAGMPASPWADAAKDLGAGGGAYKTQGMKWFFGKYADRFEIADFFEEMDPDGVRGHRTSGPGRIHRCPNDDAHSDAGNPEDQGFFCVNASEDTREQATARCSHDSCQELDRINFIDIICEREGITNAEELKRWVPRTTEDDEEEAAEAAKAVEQTTPEIEPMTVKTAKQAVGDLSPDDDEALSAIIGGIAAGLVKGTIRSRTVVDPLIKALKTKTGASVVSLREDIAVAVKRAKRASALNSEKILPAKALEMMKSLNERYAVIANGSSVRVMRYPVDNVELPELYRPLDFEYLERPLGKVDTGELTKTGDAIEVCAAKYWSEWEGRTTFRGGIVFDPTMSAEEASERNTYNLWQGFAVDGAPGDWGLLQTHMLENVCRGNEEYRDWLDTWIAHMFQFPGDKKGSAVVVKGLKGAGKSILFDWVVKGIGLRHAITMSQKEHVVGRFGAHRFGKIFGLCEEAFWAGDKGASGVLKDMITADTMQMEKKNVDTVTVANHIRLAFVSNEQWVVPAGLDDERRFFVLECGDAHLQDIPYFEAIKDQMKAGGVEAMVYYYMTYKPKRGWDWNVLRTPLVTPWLIEQAEAGFEADDAFFKNMVENRGCRRIELPDGSDIAGFHLKSVDTPEDWEAWLKQHGDANATEDALLRIGKDKKRQFLPLDLLNQHYQHYLGASIHSAARHRMTMGVKKMVERWLCADPGESPVMKVEGYATAQRCYAIPMLDEVTKTLATKGIVITHTDAYEADKGDDAR
jgi:hypothetical protein